MVNKMARTQKGRHVMASKTDPVKVWFFVVLAALFPATAALIWAVNL